jgi:hypothetical protein
VRRLLGQLRTALEREVRDRHGEICLEDALVVQSALRHEARALLAQRWLRVEADLSLQDRLALVDRLCLASDARDKCVRLLLAPRKGRDGDGFAGVYDSPYLPPDPDAIPADDTDDPASKDAPDGEAEHTG